jgi:hypothetical protein
MGMRHQGSRPIAGNLRDAMRQVPKPSAVIRRTEYGLLIELSNGWERTVSGAKFPSSSRALAAAVAWAKRHGAKSVEVLG